MSIESYLSAIGGEVTNQADQIEIARTMLLEKAAGTPQEFDDLYVRTEPFDLVSTKITTLGPASLRGWPIRKIILPNCTTLVSGNNYNNYQFCGMSELEEVDLPMLTAKLNSFTFNLCPKLKRVSLPRMNFSGDHFSWGLPANSPLEYVDLGNYRGYNDLLNVENSMPWTSLKTLIFRHPTAVVTPSDQANRVPTAIRNGTAYLYVPKILEDSYKSAENWAPFASRIRAIEDYPDITGGAI